MKLFKRTLERIHTGTSTHEYIQLQIFYTNYVHVERGRHREQVNRDREQAPLGAFETCQIKKKNTTYICLSRCQKTTHPLPQRLLSASIIDFYFILLFLLFSADLPNVTILIYSHLMTNANSVIPTWRGIKKYTCIEATSVQQVFALILCP